MLMRLPRILRAALLLIAAIPLLAGAGHWQAGGAGMRYSDLFIFGDSLADTGGRVCCVVAGTRGGDRSVPRSPLK